MNTVETDIKDSKFFKRIASVFEDSFVNEENEFIALWQYFPSDDMSWIELAKINRKGTRPIIVNEFFSLSDCYTDKDLKRKIICWLSRACCKTMYSTPFDPFIHRYFRERCNMILGVNFTEEDWSQVYARLGNGCNAELCDRFIDSNFDLKILESKKRGT